MGETLEELSKIIFPKNISGRETYRILEFISGDLNYKIYSGNFRGYFSIEDEEFLKKYEAEISGTISSKDFREKANFSFSRKIGENNNIMFSGIRFDLIPGYNLKEHNGGEVEAWEKIKESVTKYFEKQKEIAKQSLE